MIASPLTVILEYVARGEAIERALFTSYGFDAGYFERVALAPLEATSASILVIADAHQVDLDLYATRRMGRRYAAAFAHHHSAFHPKLVVLQGDASTTVGIGSANVTMTGWHSSEEIWTFVTAGHDAWPALFNEVGAWLTALANRNLIGDLASAFVRRLGQSLTRDPIRSDGPRLLTNLERPIVEQLPVGPVDEVNLYAPFHDAGARAVTDLIHRLRPKSACVGYQPNLTHLDAPALIDALAACPHGEIRELSSDRYRHGKLIEWRTGDMWWSLTGSPNLSQIALSRTAAEGNYELGVLSSITQPLMPSGTPHAGGELASAVLPVNRTRPSRQGARILEASLQGDVVVIQLTEAAPPGTTVQAIPVGNPPDKWTWWGDAIEGTVMVQVPGLGGGSWLRLQDASGHTTPAVAVLVPTVFQRRLKNLRGTGRPPELDDLFSDPDLANRFLEQLVALKDLAPTAPVAVTTVGSRTTPNTTKASSASWEDYLDGLSARMGESLASFALGIPAVPGQIVEGTATDWDEEVGDHEIGLDDDEPDSIVDDMPPWTLRIPSAHSWADQVRTRAVRALKSLPDSPACDDPAYRLMALRLTLTYMAGGAWPRNDQTWLAPVLRHLRQMVASPAEADHLRGRQGALGALALSIARSRFPPIPVTLESEQVARAATELAPLLDQLDINSLDEYSENLEKVLGSCASAAGVLEVALQVAGSDAVDNAIDTLTSIGKGIRAVRHGDTLVLPDPMPGRETLGFTATKLLGSEERAVVQVGVDKDTVVFVWVRPRLVLLRPNLKFGWRANLYQLPASVDIDKFSTFDELPKSKLIFPIHDDWATVEAVCHEAGHQLETFPR